MVSRDDTWLLIARAIPGRGSIIEVAWRASSSFRDLCLDYRNCAAALDSWRASNDPASASRAREYAELLAELAQEIEAWLDTMARDGKPAAEAGAE